jgi:hypothetical protein
MYSSHNNKVTQAATKEYVTDPPEHVMDPEPCLQIE